MSEKDVNKSQGQFNWKAETDEALGSYIEKGKDKSGYASSIFSSHTDSNDYSSSLNNGYKYDFPKDDGYIYSPSAYTSSSRSKSAIFSDMTPNSSAVNRRADERKSEGQRRPVQKNGETKKAPQKKTQKNTGKKENKPSFISGSGKSNEKISRSKKETEKKKTSSQKRPAEKRNTAPERRRPPENTAQKRQSQSARNRELERERREDERRDRNNLRFDASSTRGISADESRRALVKKKKSHRKFFAIVCVCILVFGALFAVAGYGIVEGAPIAKIVVDGNESYKKKAILAAAGIAVGDNMLLIREKKTNGIISTSLPYIESVDVKYEFPDTLKLTVTETSDKIHIVMSKNMITLDKNDKVLSNKKKKIEKGNYKIIGLEKQDYNLGYVFEPDTDNGNKEKFELAKEIIAALEKTGVEGFRDINFEDMKCITISTTDGISIYVNEKTPLERQLALAKDAINEKMKSKSKGYFDLRFEEMVVHN